jgi:hypothetical protein
MVGTFVSADGVKYMLGRFARVTRQRWSRSTRLRAVARLDGPDGSAITSIPCAGGLRNALNSLRIRDAADVELRLV